MAHRFSILPAATLGIPPTESETPLASLGLLGLHGAMDFGAAVRELREERGLSQSEAERRAGMTHSHWSKIERPSSNPRLETMVRVARALDITVAELVEAALRRPE